MYFASLKQSLRLDELNTFSRFKKKEIHGILITKLYETLVGGKMRKTGRATMVICPFHAEKKPSCALYEDTNSFYCFSCGEKGDYIGFVMKINNLSYREALEELKNL